MPVNKIVIYNPKVDEYIYDLLSKASLEEKSKLTAAELKLIGTDKALRKFVQWARLEKKLLLLTKMDMGWALQFFRTPGSLNELHADVYKQHRMKRLRPDNIEALRANGVFVVTSKEYALSAAILAQNCNSEVFFINPGYVKVSESFKDVGKRKIAKPLNPDYTKASEAFSLATKFLFDGLMIDGFVKIAGLQPIDLRILLWLFPQKNNFIYIEAIQRALSSDYKAQTVAKNCGILWHSGYIDKLPTESAKPSFTITAKGINFVGRVMQRVVDISTGR